MTEVISNHNGKLDLVDRVRNELYCITYISAAATASAECVGAMGLCHWLYRLSAGLTLPLGDCQLTVL